VGHHNWIVGVSAANELLVDEEAVTPAKKIRAAE
jgi:hypothetical protein